MRPARIAVVIGTRPEAVKLAPLVIALRRSGRLTPVVVTTGQHVSMVSEVLRIFGIVADADLAVAEAGSGMDAIAAAVLTRLGALVRAERPSAVVVQGDTTSVLGAALAAFYHQVPLAHLEAGLRSGDRLAPYPEEVHRRATALLADVHFAPTAAAAQRLVAEGIDPATVHLTGNTVVDALRTIRGRQFHYSDDRLAALHADRLRQHRRVVLVTAHRRESWGEPLERIARAVQIIAHSCPDLTVVVSVHPNPEVRKAFAPLGALDNVLLIEPEPYGSFVRLMELADLILTDSGGIQEEAPCLRTPVLVLRDVTERTEGIAAGVARIVGTGTGRIAAEAIRLLNDPEALTAMVGPGDLYGEGTAADQCLAALAAHLRVTGG
jgi:UDP-N-acetylglucosamine 2-epimerase (non-hydrolysing)